MPHWKDIVLDVPDLRLSPPLSLCRTLGPIFHRRIRLSAGVTGRLPLNTTPMKAPPGASLTSEADTCRVLITPALQAARWDTDPHSIAEQRSFTDGRIVVQGHQTRCASPDELRARWADAGSAPTSSSNSPSAALTFPPSRRRRASRRPTRSTCYATWPSTRRCSPAASAPTA